MALAFCKNIINQVLPNERVCCCLSDHPIPDAPTRISTEISQKDIQLQYIHAYIPHLQIKHLKMKMMKYFEPSPIKNKIISCT